MPSAYREAIGLGPVMRTGQRACRYEEYVEYATNRITILEAEVERIRDRSCPTRKSLKKMALCYRNRLTKRKEMLDKKTAMVKRSKCISIALSVVENMVSTGQFSHIVA